MLRLQRAAPGVLRVWALGRPSARCASFAPEKLREKLVEKALSQSGVLTLAYNNDRKLNAWTEPLMKQLFAELTEASRDREVKGVVLTGKGTYYGAGIDLSAVVKLMAPVKLIRKIRDDNQTLFAAIIDFPKPIVAAVNGPAIGAAVTTTVLMDACFASPSATFSLPFAKLGVPPEGCSSVTFAEMMGDTAAQRMLGAENWKPTAAEALAAGLITEVVEGDAVALVARASAYVEGRIGAGGGRRFDATEAARLNRVNATESAELANAFVSPKFLGAMDEFNTKRKTPQLARFFFRAAKLTLPLWQPKFIEPNYDFKLGMY
jgi:peroxisomal 3,2-trans-enoyl-CoA isomerase